MDISYLESYVVFARHLNFTSAARELNLTQPTLSKQIIAIERDVGAQLVNRNKQQLTLTHAGRVFLENASAINARYKRTLEEVSAVIGGGGGQSDSYWLF
jgi:DNA-binding transcriptional LysR family regulator